MELTQAAEALKGEMDMGLPTKSSGREEAAKPTLTALTSTALCYLRVTPGREPIGTCREPW